MYYSQDANIYEKVTSVISWNCPAGQRVLTTHLSRLISGNTICGFSSGLESNFLPCRFLFTPLPLESENDFTLL